MNPTQSHGPFMLIEDRLRTRHSSPTQKGDLLFTMCCLDSLAAILETLSTSLRDPIHTQLSSISKQLEDRHAERGPNFEIQSLAVALSQSFHLLSQMDRDIKDLRARLTARAEALAQVTDPA